MCAACSRACLRLSATQQASSPPSARCLSFRVSSRMVCHAARLQNVHQWPHVAGGPLPRALPRRTRQSPAAIRRLGARCGILCHRHLQLQPPSGFPSANTVKRFVWYERLAPRLHRRQHFRTPATFSDTPAAAAVSASAASVACRPERQQQAPHRCEHPVPNAACLRPILARSSVAPLQARPTAHEDHLNTALARTCLPDASLDRWGSTPAQWWHSSLLPSCGRAWRAAALSLVPRWQRCASSLDACHGRRCTFTGPHNRV